MKNILYFIIGLIRLLILWVAVTIRYIRDLGKDAVESYKFVKTLKIK